MKAIIRNSILFNILVLLCLTIVSMSANAQMQFDLNLRQLLNGDSVDIQIRVRNTGDALAFGTSNFVFNVDTNLLDITKVRLKTRGPWSNKYNPEKYNPSLLGYNENYVNLTIDEVTNPTGGAGPYFLPKNKDTIIAVLSIPIKSCVSQNAISWRMTAPFGDIRKWNSNGSIRDRASFFNASSIALCAPPTAILQVSPGVTVPPGTSATFKVNITSPGTIDSIYFYLNNVLVQRGKSSSYTLPVVAAGDSVSAKVFDCSCVTNTNVIKMKIGCDASFTGLQGTYCTSSFSSKLVPATSGGIFQGPGVNFGAGIWYFKPFDAGPGAHTIKYILPCKDTVTKIVVVDAAPCNTQNMDSLAKGIIYVATPRGIFTTCEGEIYTTTDNDQIIKIDSFGVRTVVAGVFGSKNFQNGPALTAKFNFPTG
ncbi:MAG TPA: hypothetical protein VF691_08180, partial [Cytophagaceae bacterium]